MLESPPWVTLPSKSIEAYVKTVLVWQYCSKPRSQASQFLQLDNSAHSHDVADVEFGYFRPYFRDDSRDLMPAYI